MRLLPPAPLAFALVLTLGGILTACGGSPAASSPLSSGAYSVGVKESLAPTFSVSTGAGSSFLSSEHTGEVVVLYFSFPG